jgi:hypothetical protein
MREEMRESAMDVHSARPLLLLVCLAWVLMCHMFVRAISAVGKEERWLL